MGKRAPGRRRHGRQRRIVVVQKAMPGGFEGEMRYRSSSRRLAEVPELTVVLQKTLECPRHSFSVAALNEPARLTVNDGGLRPSGPRTHDREPAGHRLEDGQTKAFLIG